MPPSPSNVSYTKGATMNHTTGPWVVKEGSYGKRYIQGTRKDEFGNTLDDIALTDEANARLIACAPDLLEALKETVAELKGIDPEDKTYFGSKKLREFEALISRAEGTQK